MDLFKASSYSFHLPEELIAAEPLANRSDARLLVVRKKSKTIEHRWVRDLPEILNSNYVMVANNTKVFKARLLGLREGTGGKVEFFILKQLKPLVWQGLMRAGAKVTPGFKVEFEENGKKIRAEVLEINETPAGTLYTAQFSDDPIQAGFGEVPLPPYIQAKKPKLDSDELEKYNTVFAKASGSVAAPTAGRHFTPELIARLKEKGVSWEEITLHVGLGTFKPVTAKDVRDHLMHEEWSEVLPEVAERLNAARQIGKKILSIGTTSTRTLEGRGLGDQIEAGEKPIDLFIHPGSEHQWKFVDAILTNFHLPESTLLMMIASFLGSLPWLLEIYEIAIKEKYRFYSYGDAMLILPE